MSVPDRTDIAGDAGAASGAPGVVKAAGRHRQRSRCQARVCHGVRWDVGGLGERGRGMGHGRPRAGHARDAGDRQSRLGGGGGGVVRQGPAQARQADKIRKNRERRRQTAG